MKTKANAQCLADVSLAFVLSSRCNGNGILNRVVRFFCFHHHLKHQKSPSCPQQQQGTSWQCRKPRKMLEIIIVGAGLCGLTCSIALASHTNVRVTIFERAAAFDKVSRACRCSSGLPRHAGTTTYTKPCSGRQWNPSPMQCCPRYAQSRTSGETDRQNDTICNSFSEPELHKRRDTIKQRP